VVLVGVGEDLTGGVSVGDGNNPEKLDDPEERGVVPGVDIGVHVESIDNIEGVAVSSEPHEEQGHGGEGGQDEVDEASSGLHSLQLSDVVVVPESVSEDDVER
jgi:hypothetical protein